MTSTPDQDGGPGRVAAWAAIFGASLGAGLCLALSFAPYESVKAVLDGMAQDGRVEWFTEEAFRNRLRGLRILAATLACAGFVIFRWRRSVSMAIDELLADSLAFARRSTETARTALLEESGSVHLTCFILIAALAVAARCVFLSQPIRYDEAYTFVNFVDKPWTVILSDYSQPNNHIFHTLLVKASTFVFGDDTWAIRLPAFVAGVLVVPGTYAVVRAFYWKGAALLATALVASSHPLILYSTNARGYSLVTLFFLLLLLVAWSMKRSRHRGGWIWFVGIAAAGAWTVPAMLYPFGVVVSWLVVSALLDDAGGRGWGFVGETLGATGTVGLVTLGLYTPVMFNTGLGSVVGNPSVEPRDWATLLELIPGFLARLWESWTVDYGPLLSGVLLLALVASLVFHRRLTSHAVPVVGAAAVWCGALLLLTRREPYIRVWLFLVPVVMGAAAAAIAGALRRMRSRFALASDRWYRWMGPGLSAMIAAGVFVALLGSRSVYHSDETGTMRDAAEVAAFLKPRLEPDDRIVAEIPSVSPLIYHFRRLEIPEAHIEGPPRSEGRLFVVVNRTWGHRLDDLLSGAGIRPEPSAKPQLVRCGPSSRVYVIEGERRGAESGVSGR